MNEFESFVPKVGRFLLAEIKRGLLPFAVDLMDGIVSYLLCAGTILIMYTGMILKTYTGAILTIPFFKGHAILLVLFGGAIIVGLAGSIVGSIIGKTK